MNEGRSHDDTRAKVLGDEERPVRYSDSLVASSPNRKDGTKQRSDQNNKDGRDPEAQHAIILVTTLAGVGVGVGVGHGKSSNE